MVSGCVDRREGSYGAQGGEGGAERVSEARLGRRGGGGGGGDDDGERGGDALSGAAWG